MAQQWNGTTMKWHNNEIVQQWNGTTLGLKTHLLKEDFEPGIKMSNCNRKE